MSMNVSNIIAENMWQLVNNEGYKEDSLHLMLNHEFSKNDEKDEFIYDQHKEETSKDNQGSAVDSCNP